MSEYILIFGWLAIMAGLVQNKGTYKGEYILGEYDYRLKYWVALLIFAPVIVWAGLRDSFIADTGAYVAIYEQIPRSISGLMAYLPEIDKDKGFTVLSGIIKIILGPSTERYFLVLATIQGISLVSVYRKYSIKYLTSIFLFMASTDYMSWMFNGIRQFTAVTIIFATTGLMLRKKYTKAVIVILLAATIHASALLMLPFVFIAQGRAWNRKTLLFIIGVIVIVAFAGRFTPFLDTLLSDTQYKNVVSDWKGFGDNGTNAIRVLVYSIPTILSFFGRKWIWCEDDPVINFCANMSIVSTGFYVISMFTSGIFIGRLPIYFSLYNYILLPWEIDHFFNRPSAKIITFMLLVFYMAFYYYQMHFAWGFI